MIRNTFVKVLLICLVMNPLFLKAHEQSGAIICSDEHQWIGKKSRIDINDNASDVYFVAEEVSETNAQFWKDFVLADGYRPTGLTAKDSFLISLVIAGFVDYGRKDYSRITPEQLWVIYATSQNPSETEKTKDDIEMVMTLFMSATSRISTHIGIYRNDTFAHAKHPALSVDMHACAALVTATHFPETYYMVTKPMDKMREILLNAIGRESDQIWVGDKMDRYCMESGWVDYAESRLSDFIPASGECAKEVFDRNVAELCSLDWFVFYLNERYSFKRPRWFRHGDLHPTHSLPTMVVSIGALKAKW
jgi:hypothetical protein